MVFKFSSLFLRNRHRNPRRAVRLAVLISQTMLIYSFHQKTVSNCDPLDIGVYVTSNIVFHGVGTELSIRRAVAVIAQHSPWARNFKAQL